MSFMTLGIFWIGHRTQFNQVTQSDRHLVEDKLDEIRCAIERRILIAQSLYGSARCCVCSTRIGALAVELGRCSEVPAVFAVVKNGSLEKSMRIEVDRSLTVTARMRVV
jgi:hypothetical protein